MKVFYSFILVLLIVPVMAQKPPNFSLTDTKGIEWNLYAELAKGKTVVLDFFFVDCKPCQEYTPQIQALYESYGGDTGDVVFFGISDRDANQNVRVFESTYGVTYPSCGYEGGGDTITDMFQLNYQFLSWPTYAVICPDTSIAWDVSKADSFKVLKDTVSNCPAPKLSIDRKALEDQIVVWHNQRLDQIMLQKPPLMAIKSYSLHDNNGQLVKKVKPAHNMQTVTISTPGVVSGIYYIQIETDRRVFTKKCIVLP